MVGAPTPTQQQQIMKQYAANVTASVQRQQQVVSGRMAIDADDVAASRVNRTTTPKKAATPTLSPTPNTAIIGSAKTSTTTAQKSTQVTGFSSVPNMRAPATVNKSTVVTTSTTTAKPVQNIAVVQQKMAQVAGRSSVPNIRAPATTVISTPTNTTTVATPVASHPMIFAGDGRSATVAAASNAKIPSVNNNILTNAAAQGNERRGIFDGAKLTALRATNKPNMPAQPQKIQTTKVPPQNPSKSNPLALSKATLGDFLRQKSVKRR